MNETTAKQRLEQQLRFIVEIDKAKSVLRTSKHLHGDRQENDAEHSWHLAMMAIVFAEHAASSVDIFRVVKMVLIHDLVEIDAGDTDAFNTDALLTQREREVRAADRIFALLPPDMGWEFRNLWEEFEARETPDSQFAAALDRMAGVLASAHDNGGCWNGTTVDKIKSRNGVIAAGSPRLWEWAEGIIADFERQRSTDSLPTSPPDLHPRDRAHPAR